MLCFDIFPPDSLSRSKLSNLRLVRETKSQVSLSYNAPGPPAEKMNRPFPTQAPVLPSTSPMDF